MQEENQNLNAFDMLPMLANRLEVNGLWFNNQAVPLDGYTFNNCRFDGCQLHISSTNFEIRRCYFDEKTIVHYSGDIMKVLKLFNCKYEWFYENLPFFAPSRHEDGTFSIVS